MTLVAALVAVSTLFSCAEQQQEEVSVGKSGYTYHFVLADDDTKATLTDEGVFWTEGDGVGLFPGNASSQRADVNVSSQPKTVEWSTESPLPTGTRICAYYPFQEGNTDVTSTRITIPEVQQGGSLSAMPLAGIPFRTQAGETDGVIRFLNLGSVIDFRVFSTKYAGERIKSIRLQANAGSHPVSGEATLDLTGVAYGDESTLALNWPQSASTPSSITLRQAADVARTKEEAAEGHMYMVLAPGTYSGTISVRTQTATYTFSFTDTEFRVNGLKRFNMNLDNAEREAWYVRVKSASELVDGGKYLIVYQTTGPYAFKPILNGTSSLKASADNVFGVTVTDDRIRATSSNHVEDCQVVLETASSGQYYMKATAAQGYYFYPSGSNIAAGQNRSTAVSIAVDNKGVVNITAGSNNYFKYSTSSNYFKGSTYNSSRELALYRLDEAAQKEQALRFSASSFTYVTEGQTLPVAPVAGAPQLSGAETKVTYTSDNSSVATVDAVSGALTIRGEGSTVITASAEADEDYAAASASYTLYVYPEAAFSVENDVVAEYFDYVEAHPYDPNDYSYSYVYQFSKEKGSDTRYDWPKPVPISWSTPSSGNATVLVYADAEHTKQVKMAYVTNLTSTSADIYSLIPGRRYWYVVRSGNTQIAEGRFRTLGRRRMVRVADSPSDMGNANNCRDLGGLVTTDGRTVVYDRIFRGTNMDKTTAAQKTYLKEYMGIGLDVDLRERSAQKNPLEIDQSLQQYNSIDELKTVSRMKITIGDILSAVLADKAVYIHCKVGADRTAYVCMLLEAILGVRQDLCDIDYELTSFCTALDGGESRQRNDKSASWYYYPRGIDYITGLSGGTYGNTFQAKAVNYVVNTLGISEETVRAFQNKMLEQ